MPAVTKRFLSGWGRGLAILLLLAGWTGIAEAEYYLLGTAPGDFQAGEREQAGLTRNLL
ncbi:MAG: hypothetical protein P8Y58_15045 [Novosphingobium sp.]